MKLIKTLLIGLALILCSATSQAEWFLDGKPVTDASYAKTNGKFGARIIFVDDREKLYAAWDQPTLGVSIDEVDKIARNKPISSFIVFSNAQPNRKGNANVTAICYVLNPNGEVISKSKNLEVWKNKPAPKERDLELGVDYLAVTLKDTDPLGTYTVKALVYDANADLSVELERQFTVIDE